MAEVKFFGSPDPLTRQNIVEQVPAKIGTMARRRASQESEGSDLGRFGFKKKIDKQMRIL